MIEVLQYIGTAFVLAGQTLRTEPLHIIKSFISNGIGSALLLMYSIPTAQYGFVLLNIVSIVLSIRGYINWKNKLGGKNE